MKKILILLTLTAFGSCKTPSLSETDKKEIRYAISEMFNNYHADIAKDGLTAEFEYLDQSDDFFWVPPGYESTLTYDSVRLILEMNAPLFQKIKFHWDALQIFPLSNDIANYSGIVKGLMTDTAGNEIQVQIIESGTVIKRDDGWKLLSGQSANLNP